ncbi:MAG TPA: phosphatase PAP2 family protein [Solirubrobacterales bacterium]|nr:phosphatase PAP2 family protein [Solirubrobacterales bacterium]
MSGPTSRSSTPTTSPTSSGGGSRSGAGRARLPGPLVLLALASGIAVIAIYFLVVRTYWGQRLDEHAFVGHDFFTSREAQADSFLRIVSIGSLILATTLVAAVAAIRRRPRLALLAAASIAGSILCTEVLKHVVLERPPIIVSNIVDNSYPSGHTTIGMGVAVAAMLVVPRRLLWPTAFGAGLFGSAFGVAVVAAGWHRPSDAVGAFCVVIAVAALCAALGHAFPDRAEAAARHSRRLPRVRIGTTELGLLALALGGLGLFALAALSYRGIPWTSTSAGFLLSAGAIVVLAVLATMTLAGAMLAAEGRSGRLSRPLGRPAARSR